MFKKTILTLAAVGLMASGAAAASYELNLYGASAQYKFWKDVGPAYLQEAPASCTDAQIADAEGEVGSNDQYIAQCTNANGDTYTFRVTESKSSEGVNSVQGLLTDGSSNICATDDEREMADTFTATVGGAKGTVDSIACKDVTIGASDVNAVTFNQKSTGAFKWQDATPSDWSDTSLVKEAKNLTVPAGFRVLRPIVVPFSFFVNNTPGTEVPFDGLSRVQVLNLMSGKVKNWNQFDADLDGDGTPGEPGLLSAGGDSLPVVLCMRHAGSGTHATLDAFVMRGEAQLVNTQAMPGDGFLFDAGLQPETYFNTSSSDLTKCVGNKPGAVGYADSDKIKSLTAANNYRVVGDAKYGDVKKVAFNGYYAERDNIINGNYGFWSAQWLFARADEPTVVDQMITALDTFASDPANLANSGKADWWAVQGEMNVSKTNDFSMPTF